MSDFFARPATYSYHLYLSADGAGQFWLSATDGEGPVLLRDALTPLPRYMLPEYRLNREETPIRAARLLIVRDTLLKAIGRGDAPGMHLHMGDEVELAFMTNRDGDQEPGISFFLDSERSSLIGRLPEGALYLEPGWFGRFVDDGYELIDMPGFEEDDLDWIGRRIGPDEWEELLLRAVPAMRGRSLPVRSEIEYAPEPAGRLEILDCGEDYVTVGISGGFDVLRMVGLEGYVLDAGRRGVVVEGGGTGEGRSVEFLPEFSGTEASEPTIFLMRPAMQSEVVSRLFGSDSGGTARGAELAEFARLVEREWGPLITGEEAAKFRDLHRLYDTGDWSWSLRGGPVLERGVGVVRAEPVLSAGGRLFAAAELIDAWSEGRRYLRLEDGWIDLEAPEFARSLREHGAGGGSAGLISAGFSYRQRIGLPGESAAGELPLALEGPKPAQAGEERPAFAHLRYLAGWGMNGGLHGGAERWLAELGTFAAATLAESPDCRLVVVGRRELLTALAEAAGTERSAAATTPESAVQAVRSDDVEDDSGKSTGQGVPLPPRRAEESSESRENSDQTAAVDPDTAGSWAAASNEAETSTGLILIPVSQLQKADFDEKLQADILLLLEPDASVRSDETRLFSRIDSADARVRIAVYSDEGHMNDARVRAVQIRLLKLYDSLTRSFLLLDSNTESAVPGARPPLRDMSEMKLSPWKKDKAGMAEMFVNEPPVQAKASGRGMAIPPRVGADAGAAGGLDPDTRDTQVARPEPVKSPPPRRRTPAYPVGDIRPVHPVQPQSAEREFVRRARETADRNEPEVPFAPFSSYWPTYAAMKPEQEQWYFYWRSEFRRGEKVETDLSYLFIYVYELLNGVGWDNPQEGLDTLIRVWETYRARFRRLDGYMTEWVREFALVHALDLPESSALEQTSGLLKGELLDLELARRFAEQPVELTWELIVRLSDYDATTSRFYKDAGKKTLPRVLPHIVRALDEHLIRARGIRLTGLFREADNRITERYLFRSAVYDPELYGRTFLVRAPKLGLHAQLRDFITHVVRQTENELRARFKFGGRLRGIKLDSELVGVIAEAVERELLPPEERAAQQPPKLPEVKFDLEELEKLRRDSDEVMRMLTGELMAAGSTAEPDLSAGNAERTSAAADPANVGSADTGTEEDSGGSRDSDVNERPQSDPEEYDGFETLELPEDPGESWIGEQVPGALSFEPEESGNAGTLQKNKADAERFPLPSSASSGEESESAELAAAELSASASDTHIGTHADSASGAADSSSADSAADSNSESSSAEDDWDVSALDEDWQAFAALLGPAERDMIRAVLLGWSDAQRMDIAGVSGELPETMIDRINEAAMESIGDLLIDGGEVLEEYVPNLDGLRTA